MTVTYNSTKKYKYDHSDNHDNHDNSTPSPTTKY